MKVGKGMVLGVLLNPQPWKALPAKLLKYSFFKEATHQMMLDSISPKSQLHSPNTIFHHFTWDKSALPSAGTSAWPPLCWFCVWPQCSLSCVSCLRCWNLAYPAPVPGITNSHLASSESRADGQDSHIAEIKSSRVIWWPSEFWSKRPMISVMKTLPAPWTTHHHTMGLL